MLTSARPARRYDDPLPRELDDPFATRLRQARSAAAPFVTGQVSRVIGLRFDVEGLDLPIGATVQMVDPMRRDGTRLSGEVVAVGDGVVT